MNIQIHRDKTYRWHKQKERTVRYNAKYGQIHVAAGLLDDFGIRYGEDCYIIFANDDDNNTWFVTLTQDKNADGFHLIQHKKSETQLNALMCQRRRFTRLLAQSIGSEAMRCSVSQKPTVIDGVKWFRLITSINQSSL